jgi:hypothetical protein
MLIKLSLVELNSPRSHGSQYEPAVRSDFTSRSRCHYGYDRQQLRKAYHCPMRNLHVPWSVVR